MKARVHVKPRPLAGGHAAESIRVLRPRVDRDEAIDLFAGGIAGRVRRLTLGPLQSIADLYVPFRLYEVRVTRRSAPDRFVLGLDAVAGALDLYRFDEIPRSVDLVEVHTRNHLDATLSTMAARDVVATKVKRIVYERAGFLASGHLQVDVQPVDLIHVPYWVGFFARHDAVRLVVIDAVRRQIEGVKVRRLIRRWLMEPAVV